jgi:hypothetical protein
MRFFTIHERPARGGGDPEVLAVASGFRWWAALLPPLWLLWHRLWLGLIAYIVFSTVLGVLLDIGGIADPAATAIGIAVSFLIGACAADYRRWTLARRGWQLAGVLRASNAAEAEDIYIRNRGVSPAVTVRPAPPQTFPAPALPVTQSAPRGTEAFPSLL